MLEISTGTDLLDTILLSKYNDNISYVSTEPYCKID